MKNLLLLFAMTLMLIVSCAKQQEVKSPMEGAWQVVSWQRYSADTLSWELGVRFTGGEIKIWSRDHFAFVGQYKQDTAFINNFGAGTYKLEGTHYEESFLYCVEQSWVGTTGRILLEIKNDTLIQTWPCDNNWQIDKSNYNIQKLVRKD